MTDETSAAAIVERPPRADLTVAPLTLWGATRVEHQVGASVVGFTGTLVERALAGTGLDQLLEPERRLRAAATRSCAPTTASRSSFPWLGGSGVFGTRRPRSRRSRRPRRTTSSAPIRRYLHLDSTAHSLLGWNAGTYMTKRSGMYNGDVGSASSRRASSSTTSACCTRPTASTSRASFDRSVTEPTKCALLVGRRRRFAEQEWKFGGNRKPATLHAHAERRRSPNLWSASRRSRTATTPGDVPDLTRGGPLMQVGWAETVSVDVSSPYGRATPARRRRATSMHSEQLDNGFDVTVTAATRVIPALRLDLTPSLTIVENHRQYLDTVADPAATDTFGARYLFGHLHRTEAALQLRATLALSPDLVITVYAQPFVSVGRYDQIGELAARRHRRRPLVRHRGSRSGAAHDRRSRQRVLDRRARLHGRVAALDRRAALGVPARHDAVHRVAAGSRRRASRRSRSRCTRRCTGPFDQAAIHTLAVKLSYWFG